MNKSKISEDKYNEIIELYKSGLLQREIATRYGVSRTVIGAILKKCGATELGISYKSRQIIFSDIEEQNICDMYLSGISSVKIGQKFNCTHKTITKVLDKYGIKRVGVGLRKYQLCEHYFDEIDTPNKAYILGFFYADGSICERKSTIAMSLQEDDKEILERIRNEIGSEKPLEFIDYSDKHDGGYNYKNQYRLLIFSKHMCNALKHKGMFQNKSLILEWPEFLRDDLYSHFLRGYIDGDGHISTVHNFVGFVSTEAFCVKAKMYIENKLNIHCSITDASCHNGITKNFKISTKENVIPFLHYIYRDADLYLKRKFEIFQNKYNNTQVA